MYGVYDMLTNNLIKYRVHNWSFHCENIIRFVYTVNMHNFVALYL